MYTAASLCTQLYIGVWSFALLRERRCPLRDRIKAQVSSRFRLNAGFDISHRCVMHA